MLVSKSRSMDNFLPQGEVYDGTQDSFNEYDGAEYDDTEYDETEEYIGAEAYFQNEQVPSGAIDNIFGFPGYVTPSLNKEYYEAEAVQGHHTESNGSFLASSQACFTPGGLMRFESSSSNPYAYAASPLFHVEPYPLPYPESNTGGYQASSYYNVAGQAMPPHFQPSRSSSSQAVPVIRLSPYFDVFYQQLSAMSLGLDSEQTEAVNSLFRAYILKFNQNGDAVEATSKFITRELVVSFFCPRNIRVEHVVPEQRWLFVLQKLLPNYFAVMNNMGKLKNHVETLVSPGDDFGLKSLGALFLEAAKDVCPFLQDEDFQSNVKASEFIFLAHILYRWMELVNQDAFYVNFAEKPSLFNNGGDIIGKECLVLAIKGAREAKLVIDNQFVLDEASAEALIELVMDSEVSSTLISKLFLHPAYQVDTFAIRFSRYFRALFGIASQFSRSYANLFNDARTPEFVKRKFAGRIAFFPLLIEYAQSCTKRNFIDFLRFLGRHYLCNVFGETVVQDLINRCSIQYLFDISIDNYSSKFWEDLMMYERLLEMPQLPPSSLPFLHASTTSFYNPLQPTFFPQGPVYPPPVILSDNRPTMASTSSMTGFVPQQRTRHAPSIVHNAGLTQVPQPQPPSVRKRNPRAQRTRPKDKVPRAPSSLTPPKTLPSNTSSLNSLARPFEPASPLALDKRQESVLLPVQERATTSLLRKNVSDKSTTASSQNLPLTVPEKKKEILSSKASTTPPSSSSSNRPSFTLASSSSLSRTASTESSQVSAKQTQKSASPVQVLQRVVDTKDDDESVDKVTARDVRKPATIRHPYVYIPRPKLATGPKLDNIPRPIKAFGGRPSRDVSAQPNTLDISSAADLTEPAVQETTLNAKVSTTDLTGVKATMSGAKDAAAAAVVVETTPSFNASPTAPIGRASLAPSTTMTSTKSAVSLHTPSPALCRTSSVVDPLAAASISPRGDFQKGTKASSQPSQNRQHISLRTVSNTKKAGSTGPASKVTRVQARAAASNASQAQTSATSLH